MKFGPVPVRESCGAILAHSLRVGKSKWKKGRVLSAEDSEALAQEGLSQIVAARAEPGDIGENQAAARVAKIVAGKNIRAAAPLAGRANFFAQADGLLQFNPAAVSAINLASSEIALAVPPPGARVRQNALVGTLKIIPFAVRESALQKCEAAAGKNAVLSVAPFAPRRAVLIQTVLPGLSKNILEKTRRVTEARLAELQCELAAEKQCGHSANEIADAMRECQSLKPRLYLVAGASAICDARDEIPTAAKMFGAKTVRFGMPADPGNLIALARAGNAHIIGLPGCARSPKWNGLDIILALLCADIPVSDSDIAAMGVGGLFTETPDRPAPRAPRPAPPNVCAVLLAAGASKRMRGENKLLAPWQNRPLVCAAANVLAQAQSKNLLREVVAVVGRDSEKMKAALSEFNFRVAENPNYADGMSSSLRVGINAVPPQADAALIALGDMPLITAEDIQSVVRTFSPDGGDIVIPVCNGKRGNPVLLGRAYFPSLKNIGGDYGARELLAKHPERIREAPAGPGVLTDIDTPEALAQNTQGGKEQ